MKLRWRILLIVAATALLLFGCCSFAMANTLSLPASLQVIEEEAFYGDTSLQEVRLGKNVRRIESKAFANSSLQEIYLPESIEYIANNAFSGTNITKIRACAGSYAYDWAEANNLPVVSISPVPVVSTSNGTVINVSWNNVDASDWFWVALSTSATFERSKTVDQYTSELHYSFGGLKQNTRYYVRVYAWDNKFNSWYYGINETKTITTGKTTTQIPVESLSLYGDTGNTNWGWIGSVGDVDESHYLDRIQIEPISATNMSLSWSSSNPSVAAIDQTSGIITCLSFGETIITATANDGSGAFVSFNYTVGPKKPEDVSVNVNGTTLTVSWTAFPDAGFYQVNVGSMEIDDYVNINCDPGATTATITGIAPNTTYYVVVTGVVIIDGDWIFGESNISDEVTTGNATYTPVREIQCDEWEIVLSPNDTYNAADIITVLPAYATNKTVTWKSDNTSVARVNSVSGKITAVSGGITTITATAADGSGISVSFTLEVRPGFTSYNVDGTTIQLRWTNFADTTGYCVFYSTSEYTEDGFLYDNWDYMTTWRTDDNEYELKDLEENTTYHIVVRAYYTTAEGGWGLNSDSITVTTGAASGNPSHESEPTLPSSVTPTPTASPTPTPTAVIPGIPVQNTPTVFGSSINVSWQAASNANHYSVFYGVSDEVMYSTELSGAITELSATIPNLEQGKTYYVWVYSVSADGTVCDAPAPKSVSIPGISTVSMGNSSVNVGVESETKVRFVAPSAGTYVFTTIGSNDTMGVLYDSSMAQLAANDDNSSSDRNFRIQYDLTSNQTVYIGVKYYSSSLSGTETLNISKEEPVVTPTPQPKPSAPTNVNATAISAHAVTLTWTQSTGAAGYKIYMSTETTRPSTAETVVLSSKSSETITNLTDRQTYYFWVSAYNVSGETISSRVYATTPEDTSTPALNFSVTKVGGSTLLTTTNTTATFECGADSASGDFATFTVSSNVSWSYTVSDTSWITDDRSGSTLTLTIGNVAAGRYYSTVVTFRAGGETFRLTVTLDKPAAPAANVSLTVRSGSSSGSIIGGGQIIEWPITQTFYACCSQSGGNGKYLVKSFVMSTEPNFDSTDINHLVTGVGYNNTGFFYGRASGNVNDEFDQSVMNGLNFNFSSCSVGQYVKIWIAAEDANYSQNGGLAQVQFALKLTENTNVPSTRRFNGIMWPLDKNYSYTITSRCAVRAYHPVTGTPNDAHLGIDIWRNGIRGDSILAAAGGIAYRHWYNGYGNCIVIDHENGFYTLYGHMNDYADGFTQNGISKRVNQGDIIGYVGDSGIGTGPHLHFEIRYCRNGGGYESDYLSVQKPNYRNGTWEVVDPYPGEVQTYIYGSAN